MEQLKKLVKNKKLVSLAMILAAALLVYFVGFNSSIDFASTRILEFKTEQANFEGIEAKAKEGAPVRIAKSDSGIIQFYYQNISSDKVAEITKAVNEQFKIEESKDYEAYPVFDTDLNYRYTNIALFSFIGFIIATVLLFRLGLSVVQLFKVMFAILMSLLFETAVSLGLYSILGLVKVQLSYLTVVAILFLLVASILLKVVIMKGVQDRIIAGSHSLKESWTNFAESKRKLLIEISAIVFFVSLPFIVVDSTTRFTLIFMVLISAIVLYSSLFLTPELLEINLIKKKTDDEPKHKAAKPKRAGHKSKKRKSR